MPLVLSGTDGVSGVDGTASNPSYEGTDSNTGIFFPAADTIAFAEGGAEVARFDSAGNFGIGTSSPAQHVQIGNNSSATEMIRFASTLANFDVGMTASGCEIGTANNQPIIFKTNAAERARIDSSGNLLVGTTTATGKLVVSTSENTGGGSIAATNASYSSTVLQVLCSRDTSNSSYFLIKGSRAGVADVFRVADSGNVTNTNNSYGAISDAKLKENVTDATPKLEKLNQVRIVNFNIKGEQQKQIGVIAQELEQIFPGMVEEDQDCTKAVKYSVFVPMLIKAIQELNAKVEAQAAEIAALKGVV